MDFLIDNKNNYKILTLMCGLTRESNERMKTFFDNCIKENENYIVIDLSYTKYIDSSGIALIVEYYKKFKEIKGKLALFGAIPIVKKIFLSLNLPDDIWNYNSLDEIIN